MITHPLHKEAPASTPEQSRTIPAQPERIEKRQLDRWISQTSPGRLRRLWHWLRLTVREMNYASRRMVEVQAPWIR